MVFRVLRLLVGAVLLLALVFAAYVGVIAWQDGAFKPPPAIASERTDDPKEAFTPTLRRMFPVGTDEARLLRFLRERGFEITGASAQYDWKAWPVCLYYLQVKWTTDESKRITSLDSEAENACW